MYLIILLTAVQIQLFSDDDIIVDGAILFDEIEIYKLEKTLASVEEDHGVDIVIFTLDTLKEHSAQKYATEVGNRMEVGSDEDYGMVILISKKDRKLFMATSRALSRMIPSSVTQRVSDDIVLPLLRNGKYYEGVQAGIQKMMIELQKAEDRGPRITWKKVLPFVVIGLLIVAIVLNNTKRGGGKKRGRGGPGSGSAWWVGGTGGYGSGSDFGGTSGSSFGGDGGGGDF